MEVVKKTSDYKIYKKGAKRFAVRGADKKWINGDDKVAILLSENLIKAAPPKPKAAPEAEEAPAEEAAAEEAAAE